MGRAVSQLREGHQTVCMWSSADVKQNTRPPPAPPPNAKWRQRRKPRKQTSAAHSSPRWQPLWGAARCILSPGKNNSSPRALHPVKYFLRINTKLKYIQMNKNWKSMSAAIFTKNKWYRKIFKQKGSYSPTPSLFFWKTRKHRKLANDRQGECTGKPKWLWLNATITVISCRIEIYIKSRYETVAQRPG